MNLYQFSKSKITGFSASLLVIIALLVAFSNIFHWTDHLPGQLGLAIGVLRWVLAATLIFVWIVLNIPPPKLPIGNFIIALAQFGEEEEIEGAAEGLIRAQRRYSLRREDFEDYIDDDQVEHVESKQIIAIRKARARKPSGALQQGHVNPVLPARQSLEPQNEVVGPATALALSRRANINASSDSGYSERSLAEFTPNGRSNSSLAIPGDGEEDVSLRRNGVKQVVKFTPPPRVWETVFGPRSVTSFLDTTLKVKLGEVGVSDVSVYPTNTFVGDGEVAIQQAEAVRAHAVIWGWVPYMSRRDFVPVFELVKVIEEDNPPTGEMQLLGLNSFDLGRQTAKYSTIFSSFVAGLGAYAVRKSTKTERDQNLAKAENEFGLALTAAYTYSEERRHRHSIDRAIIYFFLGNVRYYRHNLDGAAAAYREVLVLDPNLVEARHNLGAVLFAQDKFDWAIKQFQGVLQRQPNLSAARYNLGMSHLKKKQLVEGRRELNNAIKLNPKYALAYRALGLSYLEERGFDESRAYLQEAIRIKADYAQAHVDMSIACYREARSDTISEHEADQLYREATTEIEKALQINPALPEAHYQLAVLLRGEDQVDAAAEAVREAIRLNPDYSEAHLLLGEIYEQYGQTDLAQKEFELAVKKSNLTASTPEQHISLGIGYLKNKQYTKAREELETALKLQPHNPEALLQMGILYQEMGEPNQALARFQAVLRLPNPPEEVYNQISTVYKQQGDDAAAFEVIKRAVEMNPNSAKLQYYLGNAYRRQKNDVRAIDAYINAIRLNPKLPEARFNLGMLYLGRKQVQDAILQFRDVVQLRPDDFETYIFLGRSYRQLNQTDEALAALQEAIRIRPEAVDAHMMLGQIYQGKLEPELAIDQFQEVLSYRPDNLLARELLGKAYAQASKLDMAIDTFQSILAIDAENSAAHYNLGVAYTSQEHFGEAVQEFDTYIRLKPDDADGYFNLGLACNQLDRVEEAITCFKRAVQLRPTYCEAYRYLGQVYIRINKNTEAIESLNMYQRCKNGGI